MGGGEEKGYKDKIRWETRNAIKRGMANMQLQAAMVTMYSRGDL